MLVTLVGPDAGRTHILGEKLATIGRGEDCAIRLPESNVSRRHAEVTRAKDGAFLITDCDSRNGTTVNGKPIRQQRLELGDRIGIGRDVLLLFAPHDHLQEELIHQQRIESVGQLAGGIAHDFNNLLSVILGNVSALEDSPGDTSLGDPEVVEVLGEVRQAAARAASLVRQLLAFSRRANVEMTSVDFSAVVAEVIGLVSRTLDPDVRIESMVAPNLMVNGDPTQLHQVVMNLLINARDAMPKGGLLKVTLGVERLSNGRPDPRMTLTVVDTGTGMDASTQARIFEPYFTTKAVGRGTGLGLATVLGIVRTHGGEVSVTSQLDQGSSFRVRLTRIRPDTAAANRTQGSLTGVKIAGRSVLVVDDEEAYLRSAKRLLKAWGFTVTTARSGIEALALHPMPDVVLVDYMMPEIRGDAVCRQIKAVAPDVKVLAMSGCASTEVVNQFLAAGADGFLAKPFTRQELEGAIVDAFNRVTGA